MLSCIVVALQDQKMDFALTTVAVRGMTTAQWAGWCALILLTYILPRCIYLLYFHPASKFRGPKLASITNMWYAYHWATGRWPWKMEEVLRKYGNVVRIAPNEVVFGSQQAIQDVHGTSVKNLESFVKTSFMDLGVGDGGISWEEDPVKHRKIAKRLSPAFSIKSVRAMEPTIHMYIDMFVDKMRKSGGSAEGVNLRQWSMWLAMDLSADLTYGREMHQMRDEKSSEFLNAINATDFFGTANQISKKFPLLSPLAFLFLPFKAMRSLPHVLRINAQELNRRIERRGTTSHMDYFEVLVPASSPAPDPRELNHLEQVAAQILVAGYDPVANMFYGTLFFLLRDRRGALDRLVAEIRSSFQDYRDITSQASKQLPWLRACIQETFRVYDQAPDGSPRVSPGAKVDGVYIPKGVECQTSFFTAWRNVKYFHDPLSYRPERWLPIDHSFYDEQFSDDQLNGFVPFSIGPRMCPGRESALAQLRLFLAKVLWSFDLELVRGHELTFDRNFKIYTMWNKPDLWIRFKAR